MTTILVPTDFSPYADNALNYAIDLAKKENARIILLHAYHFNMQSSYSSPDKFEDEIRQIEKASDDKLKSLSIKIEHARGVAYEYISTADLALDAILKLIDERKIDLIIMGTKGATGIKEYILGSTTAKLIENSPVPVLAIPEQASFKQIKKITYATDYNTSDIEAIKRVLEIAKPYNAQLNILHVCSNLEENKRAHMKRFMEQVIEAIDYNNMSFQLLEGDDVNEELEKFIRMNYTDMLVMTTHHRDLIEKLFGKSTTKKMVHHTLVPLMVLHVKKTEPVIA